MTTETAKASFAEDWQRWHEARLRTTTSDFGTASLAHTHWMAQDAAQYEGAPGRWLARGGVVVGDELGDRELTVTDAFGSERTERGPSIALEPGETLTADGLRLRAKERDSELALRVFDPQSANRTSVAGIDTFAPDAGWVRTGRFRPADDAVEITSVDGHVSTDSVRGVVSLEIDGTPVELAVVREDGRLQAVFSGGNSGGSVYRFRFLTLPEPNPDGTIIVDFNRAYLPPCSFSDQYVCPLPLPSNRWSVPVNAGEKLVLRK